jgi:hypothetical protein
MSNATTRVCSVLTSRRGSLILAAPSDRRIRSTGRHPTPHATGVNRPKDPSAHLATVPPTTSRRRRSSAAGARPEHPS